MVPLPKVEMSHQKKLIKCTIDHLQRLQEQSSAYVYSKDEYMVFRNYVLALIQIIVPSGTIKNIRHKIDYSRSCFRKSKRYRLATIIYESTRIIAKHHGAIFVGDIPDCLIEYSHPTFSSCIHLVCKFEYSFPQEYSQLTCWTKRELFVQIEHYGELYHIQPKFITDT